MKGFLVLDGKSDFGSLLGTELILSAKVSFSIKGDYWILVPTKRDHLNEGISGTGLKGSMEQDWLIRGSVGKEDILLEIEG